MSRVVVLTGASSGIGRATARELARRGASLVLAARRERLLDEAVADVQRLGARAVAVPTDVTDADAVVRLAERAVDELGRIDVWINNAGVYQLGGFEATPPNVFARVVETNFFGYVNGARAALPVFRRQGAGVLIMNASVSGHVGPSLSTAYAASKWAVRGFAAALRAELRGSGIHVAVVSPASIDTPLFRHSVNYAGRVVRPMRPVYEPERVARVLAGLAERPRREVVVGPAGKAMVFQRRLAPGLFDRLFASWVERDHFTDEPAPPSPGNAFEPVDDLGDASGGYDGSGRRAAARAAGLVLAAAAPVAVAAWRRR